jgi:hypothetical protein
VFSIAGDVQFKAAIARSKSALEDGEQVCLLFVARC